MSTFYHLPCIYMKCSDGQYFQPPQVNKGDAAEKFLEQVLATPTICRQHLASNIPMKRLTQEKWRESTMPPTTQSTLNHSNQQIENSATTNI